jgi:hypothetical protein
MALKGVETYSKLNNLSRIVPCSALILLALFLYLKIRTIEAHVFKFACSIWHLFFGFIFCISAATASGKVTLSFCQEQLDPHRDNSSYHAELVRRWEAFNLRSPLAFQEHHLSSLTWSERRREPKTVQLDSLIDFEIASKFELWDDLGSDKKFVFIDASFKGLERDARNLNSIVLDHMLNTPEENLILRYGAYRTKQLRILYEARWALHAKVLQVYSLRKQYLDFDQIMGLVQATKSSDNSDVFGVLDVTKDVEPFDWLRLDSQKIKNDAVLSIQISYFEKRSFFRPSLNGILDFMGVDYQTFENRFPFENRLKDVSIDDFRKDKLKKFKLDKTCELTRFSKFANVSEAVQARLLLKAFRSAENRGMQSILASADPFTFRLFTRKYHFKNLTEIPTETGSKEFLLYIHVDSPNYLLLIKELEESVFGAEGPAANSNNGRAS